jgi:FkbM family methyltransferase
MSDFSYEQGRLNRTLRKRKKNAYRKLIAESSQNGMSLFVRTNDPISSSPIIHGDYDPVMMSFNQWCSQSGYDDFFIDVGANIGLSCCLNAHLFNLVFAYEPNPLAFKILEVNTHAYNSKNNISVNNFGLGPTDDNVELVIPKHNWGGAFIADENNAYSNDLLASKDGFTAISNITHTKHKVRIKDCQKEIQNVFSQVKKGKNDNAKGVIKIDVEGYEKVILGEIAKAIPEDISLFLVFENWQKNLDLKPLLTMFSRPTKIYLMDKKRPLDATEAQSILERFKRLVVNARCEYKLFELSPDKEYADLYGEIVIHIPPI